MMSFKGLEFGVVGGSVTALMVMIGHRSYRWWDTRRARRNIDAWLTRLAEMEKQEARHG